MVCLPNDLKTTVEPAGIDFAPDATSPTSAKTSAFGANIKGKRKLKTKREKNIEREKEKEEEGERKGERGRGREGRRTQEDKVTVHVRRLL